MTKKLDFSDVAKLAKSSKKQIWQNSYFCSRLRYDCGTKNLCKSRTPRIQKAYSRWNTTCRTKVIHHFSTSKIEHQLWKILDQKLNRRPTLEFIKTARATLQLPEIEKIIEIRSVHREISAKIWKLKKKRRLENFYVKVYIKTVY